MTPDQADFFTHHGWLRLPAFHPAKRLAPLRQALQDEIKRLGALPGARSLPRALQGLPVFQQIGRLSALVAPKAPALHDTLVTPPLRELITRLGGGRPVPPGGPGTQLLLSPPRQGAWTLQGLNWHVDLAAEPHEPLPGVQAFFLIDDVAPHGGATLALAGSHRVPTRSSTKAAAASPPLREVLARTPAAELERRLADLGIQIVEMCGRAGDVFLMDMRVLHTPAVNATQQVRMMATCRWIWKGGGGA